MSLPSPSFELSGKKSGHLRRRIRVGRKDLLRRSQVEGLLAFRHAGADFGLVAVGLDDGLTVLDHVLLSDSHGYAKRNTSLRATAKMVRIMWWSPCEVVLVRPNRQSGQKVTGESSSPLPRPVGSITRATNTGIMTLFRGRVR